ncbi:MAG: hypothetical protein ACE5JL_00690 [Dehalococcoidia bacterium]
MLNAYQALRTGSRFLIHSGRAVWASQSGALRLAGLVGILLFSFWAGMSPHWDYPYPLHVDEWFAIGRAQSTLDANGLQYPSPYGQGEISFHPEMGFHLMLGFLKTATGLSWMGLYRVAPGVLLALMAFLTYAFGRRSGFGWAAALFVPLIPTSIRTLGPAFVVPLSAAMLFIPVTLLALHTMEARSRGRTLWVLVVLIGGTIFVHPPTEGVVTALAVLYLASFVAEALARRRYREGVDLVLAMGARMLIPVVILGLWLPSVSKQVLTESMSGAGGIEELLGFHTGFPEAFGVVAVAVSIVGLFFFISRGEYGAQSYILPLFTGLLLAFQLVFFPRYQLGPAILYERGWSYLGLLMAILAGYGVAVYFRSIPVIARALASWVRRTPSGWMAVSLWLMGIALVLFALTTGLVANEDRQGYPRYYHLINGPVYADFRWIGQHTAPGQTVAIGEPSMGWAYPPVAGPGKTVFEAVASPWTTERADRMRRMLASGDVDVLWLREQDVSVFYACWPVTFTCEELTSNELFKVRHGVYLVPNSSDTR